MTAKIKLNAASGGGSISIQAPSSSSNNRVISLPDIADGTLLTSQSSLDSTKLSPAVGGIEEVDTWRMTSNANTNNSSTDLTANWARNTATGFNKLGTGMSESSGIFTFPSTGFYLVDAQTYGYLAGGTSASSAALLIYVTPDNSNYSQVAGQYNSIGDAGGGGSYYYRGFAANTIIDVTNTSNIKVKFQVYSDGNVIWSGHTNFSRTWINFTKLAET